LARLQTLPLGLLALLLFDQIKLNACVWVDDLQCCGVHHLTQALLAQKSHQKTHQNIYFGGVAAAISRLQGVGSNRISHQSSDFKL
jgi:hypothetical protein